MYYSLTTGMHIANSPRSSEICENWSPLHLLGGLEGGGTLLNKEKSSLDFSKSTPIFFPRAVSKPMSANPDKVPAESM